MLHSLVTIAALIYCIVQQYFETPTTLTMHICKNNVFVRDRYPVLNTLYNLHNYLFILSINNHLLGGVTDEFDTGFCWASFRQKLQSRTSKAAHLHDQSLCGIIVEVCNAQQAHHFYLFDARIAPPIINRWHYRLHIFSQAKWVSWVRGVVDLRHARGRMSIIGANTAVDRDCEPH